MYIQCCNGCILSGLYLQYTVKMQTEGIMVYDWSNNNNGQLTVGQCLRPRGPPNITKRLLFVKLWEKGPALLTQDTPLCNSDTFKLFLSNTHTHKDHGNKLANRVTPRNNANLSPSLCGSSGNNKNDCFLCGKSKLSIMFV